MSASSPGFHLNLPATGYNPGGGFTSPALRPPGGYALALDLTNPQLLADGSGNRLTSGSTGTVVAEVYDIDGVRRANQTFSGNRTTWSATDGLQGNGIGYYTLLDPITVNGDATFVAAQIYSGGAGQNVAIGSALGTAPYASLFAGLLHYNSTGNKRSAISAAAGTYVTSWRSTQQLRRNGVDLSPTNDTPSFTGPLTQLLRWVNTPHANTAGNCVKAVLIWQRVLTLEEVKQAEQWAALRAGITLP